MGSDCKALLTALEEERDFVSRRDKKEMELKGRLVVITGSAQGLGKAFAKRLLQDGARVCLSDIQEPVGLATKTEFQEKFGSEMVHFVRCDVTKMEDVVSLYDEAEEHFKDKVDIWCNNAGINHNAGWRKCMDIDIMVVMMGTYYAMERMSRMKGGRGGLIVNTASAAGLVFNQIQDREISDANSYFVAKHGVVTLTRMLANPKILEETGVRVVCICPSFADTNIIREGMEDKAGAVRAKIESWHKIMTPEYVAEAFYSLVTNCPNGSALMIARPDVPFFTFPDTTVATTIFLALGAKLGQLLGIRVFQWYHQLIFAIIALYLFNLISGLFLSFIF